MQIQINTDKTINGDERQERYFTTLIEGALARFESHITKIEVHLSDENGNKEGANDIRCLLEAKMKGRDPIAVSANADKIEVAINGAIDKAKSALETVIGKMQNR